MNKSIYNTVAVIIIFVVLTCLFYSDKLILGPHAAIRVHDTFDSEFSRYASIGGLLVRNGLFAWNPLLVCGMPSYAYHFPPYYILCLLTLMAPVWWLYAALTMLMMFIAGFGMYWFLRDFLRLSARGSFLGGFIFSLLTQTQTIAIPQMTFYFAFPMFFMCFIAAGNRGLPFVARILSAAFILLVFLLSYPVLTVPMFFVLQCLVVLFLSFDRELSRSKMLIKTVLIWGSYILLSAPVLYSLYKFIPFSHRTYSHLETVPVPVFVAELPFAFLAFFLQCLKDSYLLLPALTLIPIIFYSCKVRRVFYAFIMVVFLAVFFQKPLSVFCGTIFEKMDLGHFFFIIPILAIAFVITGLDELFRIKPAKKIFIFSFFAAAAAMAVMWFGSGRITEALNITATVSIFLFCAAPNIRYGKLAGSLAVIFLCFLAGEAKIARLIKYERMPYDRILGNSSIFDDLKEEAEKEPFRVATAQALPFVAQSYGLETVETRSPLIPKRYKEFFRQIVKPQLRTKEDAANFDDYWYNLYLMKDGVSPINLPLLLMINTKYIVSLKRDSYLESVSERTIEEKNEYNTYYIYQLRDYFPRAYLAIEPIMLDSDEKVLEQLSAQSAESLRRKAFFLKKDIGLYNIDMAHTDDSDPGVLKIAHLSPDKIVFRALIANPRILVITNNYHPNWRVDVNGSARQIFRVNHAFQAVFLDSGSNLEIIFYYKDDMLWKLHSTALLGLILIISFGIALPVYVIDTFSLKV